MYLHDQNTRENNVDMFRDLRAAVDGVDPERQTFAYSDTCVSKWRVRLRDPDWALDARSRKYCSTVHDST